MPRAMFHGLSNLLGCRNAEVVPSVRRARRNPRASAADGRTGAANVWPPRGAAPTQDQLSQPLLEHSPLPTLIALGTVALLPGEIPVEVLEWNAQLSSATSVRTVAPQAPQRSWRLWELTLNPPREASSATAAVPLLPRHQHSHSPAATTARAAAPAGVRLWVNQPQQTPPLQSAMHFIDFLRLLSNATTAEVFHWPHHSAVRDGVVDGEIICPIADVSLPTAASESPQLDAPRPAEGAGSPTPSWSSTMSMRSWELDSASDTGEPVSGRRDYVEDAGQVLLRSNVGKRVYQCLRRVSSFHVYGRGQYEQAAYGSLAASSDDNEVRRQVPSARDRSQRSESDSRGDFHDDVGDDGDGTRPAAGPHDLDCGAVELEPYGWVRPGSTPCRALAATAHPLSHEDAPYGSWRGAAQCSPPWRAEPLPSGGIGGEAANPSWRGLAPVSGGSRSLSTDDLGEDGASMPSLPPPSLPAILPRPQARLSPTSAMGTSCDTVNVWGQPGDYEIHATGDATLTLSYRQRRLSDLNEPLNESRSALPELWPAAVVDRPSTPPAACGGGAADRRKSPSPPPTGDQHLTVRPPRQDAMATQSPTQAQRSHLIQ